MDLNLMGLDWEHKNPSEEALRQWRSSVSIVNNRRRRFRMVADLDKRSEDELRKLKLKEKIRAALYVQSAALVFIEAAEPRRIQAVKGHICELLGKYEKRALAVFYLVLEAASFLLDIFAKSKRSILLAAFLLSASGFAITMSTHTCIARRSRAATRMHSQKPLLMVLEISFSVVQLIVTLINFILAELGVKNNFNASAYPLVFAAIAAVFTFRYDGEVSDNQVHYPNISAEDVEANGSLFMASGADHQLQNIQDHNPSTNAEDAEANSSLSMAPAAGLHMRKVHMPTTHNKDAEANGCMPMLGTNAEDAEANSSLSMAPSLHMRKVHMPTTHNEDAEANSSMPMLAVVTSDD